MNQTRDLGDLTFCLSITVAPFVAYKRRGERVMKDRGKREKKNYSVKKEIYTVKYHEKVDVGYYS